MLPAQTAEARSSWRFFPHAIVAALGVVVLVNAGMIWSALSTFPGVAQRDVFDASNAYDRVLTEESREQKLGWQARAVGETMAPELALTDRAARSLAGATVQAAALRPLGPDHRTPLAFREVAPGRYVAAAALPEAGQWDLRLTIVRAGQTTHATVRIVAR